MNDDFISEDDLLTFEGFLKYQAVDPTLLTPDELGLYCWVPRRRRVFSKQPAGR